MKTNKTLFQIELDTNELDTILDALHDFYMTNKRSENMTNTIKARDARTLRNDFANLINRGFAGVDA